MSDKTLTRIGALLRKAESTDNEHEADAYLQAAQRLATLASVDLAVARSHAATREQRSVPTQVTIEIGEPGKRGLKTYVKLFVSIAHANSLTCDVAGNSTRVFAYGFATDIEVARSLYASLVVQMVRSCDAYIKSGDYASEFREPTWERDPSGAWRAVRRPVHASTARINFQDAFALRIGERLRQAREQAEQQAIDSDRRPGDTARAGATGVALVLRAKEVELADFYRSTSTARGTWQGYKMTAGYSEVSRRAGDRAGRSARIGEPNAIGGSRPGIGR